ncbi:26S proteasome non-ATPase regulatory subunit 4 [Tanacetum coccineum]|uniref:26S proteasome non-ATPase regulatory subunit 4 n=1 Tax=Tanacetum coccineum TaxID=301880 RepID=A0ABQ4YGI5_9ASTR
MRSAASLGAYYNQLEAIDLYCHAKLESNPKNAIGLYTMGGVGIYFSYLEPTSDVDKIMAHLHKGIIYGGDLDLTRGVSMSLSLINQRQWRVFKHKRLLFFVGGPSKFPCYSAKAGGDTAKQMGVAVDVVNFSLLEKYNYCKTALVKFVAAANNNGNSHIKHIPPASSYTEIREALSSSPPIITRASIRQGEIAAAAWKKIAKEKENRRKRKENHVAPAPPPKVPRLKPDLSLLMAGGDMMPRTY